MSDKSFCILVCDSFKAEIDVLSASTAYPDVTFASYPARCGRPPLDWAEVEVLTSSLDFCQLQLMGGTCLAGIGSPPDHLAQSCAAPMENCFRLLVSQYALDSYLAEGSYLVTPGWLADWRQRVDEWGFQQGGARDFFGEWCKKILLLDSGVLPESQARLEEFARFVDRPWQVVPVGLDLIKARIDRAVLEWRRQLEARQLAGYAVAIDLLGSITEMVDEEEVVQRILTFYGVLFGATDLAYVVMDEGAPVRVIKPGSPGSDDTELLEQAASLTAEYRLLPAVEGFLLAIKHDKEVVGVLRACGIPLPRYRDQYLSLALATAAVCGLALDNARSFQLNRSREAADREAARREAERSLHEETLERLRVSEALREKERLLIQQSRLAALGEMINNIAHQWRQPLNAVGLMIQDLQMMYDYGELSREQLAERVGKVMGVIGHMSQTIDDFRNFFRPEKKKVPFSTGEVVSRTLSLVEESFRSAGIVIEVEASGDPIMEGYPNEFSQVLLNILLNARDAFSTRVDYLERRIRIVVSREGERSVVTIADNAGGICETIIGKIFDPYFTTKGPDKGTGVGLYMARTIIVDNMNGSISARNLEEGAEFRIEV